MDKKSIIGIVLIVLIFVGFELLNRPSKEEIARRQEINDSISRAKIEQQDKQREAVDGMETNTNKITINSDSVKQAVFGLFARTASGDNSLVEIKNEDIRLKFSPKGGYVAYAELLKHKTHDKQPLVLFDGEKENSFDFVIQTSDNRVLSTKEMYFNPTVEKLQDGSQRLTMRLQPAEDSYIDFIYTLGKEGYKLDFSILPHNMQSLLAPMSQSLDFIWQTKIRQQERGRVFENRYTTLNYMYADHDIERLSERKTDTKSATTPTMWFAAKDQYFSTILLNKNHFSSAQFKSEAFDETNEKYLKAYTVNSTVDIDLSGQKATELQLFFVPNQYKILKSFNEGLSSDEQPDFNRLLTLGWTLFRWISQFVIIPLFNFFSSFISNWGIIILLVTLVIKIILLPLTYKSYMSTAKMRVLKPQIDAINARIPEDKMMERQQAQMALYRSVGVSPMGGCLPMLLQMPILVAVFMYLPTAIELRQQGFLWVQDLSTYDTIPLLDWKTSLPLIGNHLSIFCLLMTATNIIYTKVNMATQATGTTQQMAMMKWMMYLMPLIFFFMFNDYAAGLTYYYFISLLLTVAQTYLFRLFVNDEKLLQKLELAKQTKKPSKKSGFMARLEEAQKRQQMMICEQQKRQNKNR